MSMSISEMPIVRVRGSKFDRTEDARLALVELYVYTEGERSGEVVTRDFTI